MQSYTDDPNLNPQAAIDARRARRVMPFPAPVVDFPAVAPVEPPIGQLPPSAPTVAHVGTSAPATLSPLGRKLAEYHARQNADVGTGVKRTDWGYEEQPPRPGGPSRWNKGLEGFLTGGALAATSGPTEGAFTRFLAGGGTGAIMGAVKPRLIEAFQRDQELAKLRGEITEDQSIESRNAQIAETRAQAAQRVLQPQVEQSRLELELEKQRQAQADREADNRRADRGLEETRRANDLRAERNRDLRNKPASTGPNERVVQDQIFRKDQDGVWRVAPGSPPPRPSATEDRRGEKSAERTAKARQASSLYQKGSDYWDQAKAKRAEADTLSKKKFVTDADRDRIKVLTREAEGLENKTREVQLEGDKLAAQAESTPAESTSARKTFNLRAWKADHPNATTAEIEAKRRQYSNYRIVE